VNQITKDDQIGVIAPAWIPIPERLEKGCSYLKKRGYRVKLSPNITKKHAYFAGTDEQRLEDIHTMFRDPQIDAIFCARGGWGGLRLIDQLDYNLIAQNPKPFVGYSDVTTLQLALWKMIGMPSFSGPMVAVEMGKGIELFTETHFWGLMENKNQIYQVDLRETSTTIHRHGKANGVLLGGCLAMISTLLGTPFSPDFRGSILFIEDVGEQPYKIDRYLAHLKQAGIFEEINGLILGEFLDCVAEEDDVSFTIAELIDQYFSGSPYPVIKDFPYGHGDLKVTMPIGCRAEIDTSGNTIQFSNPFFNPIEQT
jgi:muramoyltetrapeptide carboxypeptidase